MPSFKPSRVFALVLAAGLPLSALAQQPAGTVQVPPGAKIVSEPQPDPAAANFPLKFDHTTFDWGDIPDTEKVSHVFKFTNGSDKTITISGLQGSCGCTAGTLSKNDYAPGEGGEITATFDPTNRVGPQPKTLTVNLKDGGSFVLHLSSNVKPFVYIDQQKLQFMEIMKGTETTQGFTVIGRSADFAVTKVEVANPEVITATVDAPEVVEENGEKLHKVHIKVSCKPTLPIGVASSQITVTTNETKKPTLSAVATVQVVGELRTAPPMLYIRQNQPSVQFDGEALIDNRLNKPFEITSIDVEGPQEMQLVADFSNNPNGNGFMVKLSGVTPGVPGQYRGNVIVKTSVPDENEVKIGFFCNVFNPNGTLPPAQPINKPTATSAVPSVGATPGASPIIQPAPAVKPASTTGGH